MADNKVIFVLGGPGAGKGTQCERMVSEFDFVHLSAGDLLRAERADPTSKNGQLIDEYIKEGKIVPVEITVQLLKNAMEASDKSKFLIDGFPRNNDNLDGWYKVMGDAANVEAVLFFDCPEETCLERALKRGETSGRTDDNVESWRKRYRTFVNDSLPIVNVFKEKGIVHNISSVPSPDEVFVEVTKVLKEHNLA
eukprot:Clim_evm10s152 gene=Clim_evmTU10s152